MGEDSTQVAEGGALGVVVVHYASLDHTAACLESIRASDHRPAHVIVVDNGSDEGDRRRLAEDFPEVEILAPGRNLGFTGGYNLGLRTAVDRGCDPVLILNNDTVLDRGCIGALVAAASRDPKVGAVGGKILYYDRPDLVWFAGGSLSVARGLGLHLGQGKPDPGPELEGARPVTFLTGCCMLLPARAVRDVGYFEEDFFMYVEDVDLSLRLQRAGYTLLYEPAARLYHRVSLPEAVISPEKIVLRDRNRRRLARRRYRALERIRFAAVFYPTRVLNGLRYAVSGDFGRLRATLRGMVAR